MRNYNILFLAVFFFSCAAMREVKEAGNINSTYKLRYLNLNLIIEYMVNNDPVAKNLKKQKEDIIKLIDTSAGMQMSALNDIEKKELLDKQNQYRKDLADRKREEDAFKSKTLNSINLALENIAKNSDIDFVFNIGEGTVYAKKEYDITEEVLREIIKQKDRSSPVTR
jgi:Skp family chaperone for outer membrane proteins